MPTISLLVNVMKEAEMDTLATPWANARAAHLLVVHRMMPMEVGVGQKEKFDMNDDDLLMHTQKAETLEPFSSHIIPVKTGKAYLGECINVMVQALQTQSGSLPLGLTVQNTYSKLRKGSKKQLYWYRIILPTHKPFGRKPQWPGQYLHHQCLNLPESKGLQEGTHKSPNSHIPRLTLRQRHGKLFDELDLSGLDSWTPELADAAHQHLAEYHNVFSLDPAELGCTHSTEHTIKVTDDTLLKNSLDKFHCQWLRRSGII